LGTKKYVQLKENMIFSLIFGIFNLKKICSNLRINREILISVSVQKVFLLLFYIAFKKMGMGNDYN